MDRDTFARILQESLIKIGGGDWIVRPSSGSFYKLLVISPYDAGSVEEFYSRNSNRMVILDNKVALDYLMFPHGYKHFSNENIYNFAKYVSDTCFKIRAGIGRTTDV